MMRYAARRDANHGAILEIFEAMLAGNVTDSSGFGEGAGDLYVSYGPYGAWIEIKATAAANLTPAQEKFHRLHKGCIFRVEDPTQAENVARIVRARGMVLASEERKHLADFYGPDWAAANLEKPCPT